MYSVWINNQHYLSGGHARNSPNTIEKRPIDIAWNQEAEEISTNGFRETITVTCVYSRHARSGFVKLMAAITLAQELKPQAFTLTITMMTMQNSEFSEMGFFFFSRVGRWVVVGEQKGKRYMHLYMTQHDSCTHLITCHAALTSTKPLNKEQ